MIDYVLKYSLNNRFPVFIIYQKGIEINQRKIQVFKMEGASVLAYCYLKRGIRSFKRESILSAQIPENKRCEKEFIKKGTIPIVHEDNLINSTLVD
ncbi:hypothetical protein [Alkaliphilus crotonatoxidans]